MESKNTELAKRPQKTTDNLPKDAQLGLTTTDGKTITPPRKAKTINITTRKQATWIKSTLQGKSRSKKSEQKNYEWIQTIREYHPPGKIVEENSKETSKSPLDVIGMEKEMGIKLRIVNCKKSSSTDVDTVKTPEEKRMIDSFSAAASKETILSHLMKSTVHMQIRGASKKSSGKDEMQTAFLLSDYTDRLFEHKVKEVDLFLSLDYFIENGDGFFPSYAKLHKHVFGRAAK